MINPGYQGTATWAEITAQPAIWHGWGQELANNLPELKDWIASLNAPAIWFSGAGTSAYIGDHLAAVLGPLLPIPVQSVPSTDLVATPRMLDGRAPLVVSFGRSGDSAESIGVMDALDARAPDAPRLNITCNRDSSLAHRTGRKGRVILLPDATHDTGFAMTSSYTTMVLTALGLFDPGAHDASERFSELADRAEALIPRAADWASSTELPSRAVFIGGGNLRHAAREAALKVMELTGGAVAALSDSCLGFRHGPKSFIQDATRIVLFRSPDPYAARFDDDLARELSSQFPAADLTVVGPGAELDTGPGSDEAWDALLQVLVAQVLAVDWSSRLGCNVDDPFAGQGTLTRVVSGVTLHDPSEA